MTLPTVTRDTFLQHLAHILMGAPGSGWWVQAACRAVERGHYRLIGERGDSGSVYLARFWISTPTPVPGGHPDDQGFESEKSAMLHYFLRGDDDNALHDHPWDFGTTILNGGYTEITPGKEWLNKHQPIHGPPIDARAWRHVRRAGDVIWHRATDLHMVEEVNPGTWTLVTTRNRVRSWGFWPEHGEWTDWRTYLGLEAAA